MIMYIKVNDGIITDVKFMTFGCGSAITTSSIATEMIKGKSIEDALELSNKAVVEALGGLPVRKIHCSVLAKKQLRQQLKITMISMELSMIKKNTVQVIVLVFINMINMIKLKFSVQ